MSSYNKIEKYQYTKEQSEIVSLNEYLFVYDNQGKNLLLKLQNHTNQILYHISLEILQYDKDNFLIAKSVIDYKDIINPAEEFVPKAKMSLLIDCVKIEYNLIYAKYERFEYKDQQFIPIPFTIQDFKNISDESKKQNKVIKDKIEVRKEKKVKSKKSAKKELHIKDCTKSSKSLFYKVVFSVFSLLLITSMVVSVLYFKENSNEYYNGVFQYKINDEYAYITGVNSELKEVTIPERIDDKIVVSIESNAFSFSSIEKINILFNGLTIESKAFKNALNLKEIHQGTNVSKIIVKSYAFKNCKNLEIFNLPCVTSIGTGVFENCKSLTELNLPNATFKKYSLKGCSNLTSLSYYSTQSGITFYQLFENDVDSVPKSLKKITTNISYISADYFGRTKSIEEIILLNPSCDVEYGAFKHLSISGYYYTDLFEAYNDKVSINPNLDISNIIIDNNVEVEYIDALLNALSDSNLKIFELTIDYTIEEIDFKYDFYYLEKLNVSNQTKFTNSSFYKCRNLSEIDVFNSSFNTKDNSILCLNNINNFYIQTLNINAKGCKFIDELCLKGLVNLDNIYISEDTTLIKNLFSFQSSLKEITMPFTDYSIDSLGITNSILNISYNGVQYQRIESYYLQNYYNITSIVFPEGINSVGMNAIIDNTKLSKLVFPNSIKNMDLKVIDNCPNLSYIVTPFIGKDNESTISFNQWNSSYEATRYLKITSSIFGGSEFSLGLENVIALSFEDAVEETKGLLNYCNNLKYVNFTNQDSIEKLGANAYDIVFLNNCKNIDVEGIITQRMYFDKKCDLSNFNFKVAADMGMILLFEEKCPYTYDGSYVEYNQMSISNYFE